jgi:hypothetical protein
VGAGRGRQARWRPTLDRQRVDVALAGMGLGAGDEETAPIGRQLDRRDLPRPAVSWRAGVRRRRRVDHVQVHPAVPLRQEPQRPLVGQPPESRRPAEPADLANPRLVVQVVEQARLTRAGLEADEPPVLVVGRAHRHDDVRPVRRHDGHRPPHLAGALPAAAIAGARRWWSGGSAGEVAEVGPRARARAKVEDRQAARLLGIADARPGNDVFDVRRLGDVVGHAGGARGRRAFGDQQEHVRPRGREHRISDPLTFGELEARHGPAFSRASRASRRAACSRTWSMSARSSCLRNVWLSVGLGSGRFGPTSTSCSTRSPSAAATGTMKRLLSRVNVTCVSPRAQRGLVSAPDVRVIMRRVRATVSTSTMSPSGAAITRARRLSHVPPTGGASRRSSSVSRRGAASPASVGPRGGFLVAGRAPFEVQRRRVARPPQARWRVADEAGPRMMLSTVSAKRVDVGGAGRPSGRLTEAWFRSAWMGATRSATTAITVRGLRMRPRGERQRKVSAARASGRGRFGRLVYNLRTCLLPPPSTLEAPSRVRRVPRHREPSGEAGAVAPSSWRVPRCRSSRSAPRPRPS